MRRAGGAEGVPPPGARRGRAYNAAHFDRETLLRQLTDFMLGQGIPPAGDC